MPKTFEDALRDPKRARATIPPVFETTLPKPVKERIITTLSYAEQQHYAWVLNLEQFILNVYNKLKDDYAKLKECHGDTSVSAPSLTNYLQKDNKDDNLLGLLQNVYEEQSCEKGGHTTRTYDFKDQIRATIHHNTVCINGIWHSMPVEIIVELRTEYFTVSTTIDLGQRSDFGLYEDCEPFCYKDVHQALTYIDEVMARRYAAIKKPIIEDSNKPMEDSHKPIEDSHKPIEDSHKPIEDSKPIDDSNKPKEDSNKLTTAYATLYQIAKRKSVWNTCSKDLFGPAIEQVEGDNLGRFIGDMRCLLLRYRNDKPDKHFITLHHPEEDEVEPSTPSLLIKIKGHPFSCDKGDDDVKRMDDIIRIVDTIKPFMLADPGMAASTPAQRRKIRRNWPFQPFLTSTAFMPRRSVCRTLIRRQGSPRCLAFY